MDNVPSEISYTSTGKIDKWGYAIKLGEKRLSWLILLLDPPEYLGTDSAINRSKKLIPSSKTPVDVVSDFLSCLKKHTLEILQQHYGKSFINATQIDYIVTVPAVRGSSRRGIPIEIADFALKGLE